MGRKELRYLSIARTLLAGLLCLSTSAHPAPEWTVKPGTKLVPDPALTEPDEQLVASFGGFGVGTCAACSSIRRRPPQPITIPPPPASPSLPAGKLEGGCDRMANVGKEVVWKVYGNHQYSYPPKCGVGVFRIYTAYGIKDMPTQNRNGIEYQNHILQEKGFKPVPSLVPDFGTQKMSWDKIDKLNHEMAAKAPIGATLVFAGPCTQDYKSTKYPKPEGRFSCGDDGGKFGDVRIKGQGGCYYSDILDCKKLSLPHRYLVGVWLPPGNTGETCEIK